jgi:hypothetical protein
MDQRLALHGRTLNCVRGVLDGLSQEHLLWEQPMPMRRTGTASHGATPLRSLAILAWHVLAAERYLLRKVGIEPEIQVPAREEGGVTAFQEAPGGVET